MRSITPTLSPELSNHVEGKTVASASALAISSYTQLVTTIAKLAYLNEDQLLYFRGQSLDFKNRAGTSTFYPSIYRDDYVKRREIAYRFEVLDQASTLLTDGFKTHGIKGHTELQRKHHIQWSILQHYSVCRTPLFDLTHSLRVACSFAQIQASGDECFVYVFGLPYLTGRISINSEHDMVIVRLLSICPPDALRPYFQDGYLAGTEFVTTGYLSKTELDFKNRLIAKFRIPASSNFWGSGFEAIPERVLFPNGDTVEVLCNEIETSLGRELLPGTLGEFVSEWARLESTIVEWASETKERLLSTREAIGLLRDQKVIDDPVAFELDRLRKLRNQVVHRPKKVEPEAVGDAITEIQELIPAIDRAIDGYYN